MDVDRLVSPVARGRREPQEPQAELEHQVRDLFIGTLFTLYYLQGLLTLYFSKKKSTHKKHARELEIHNR